MNPRNPSDSPANSELPMDRANVLFLAYRQRLKGIAARYAPSPDLVEDVLQEVYLEFVNNRERWDLDKDAAVLLFGMTRNFARRHWRERLRLLPENQRRLYENLQQAAERRSETQFDEELKLLEQCVRSLPKPSRELLERHYREKTPIIRLAEESNRDPATLRSVFARIRRKLRDCVVKKKGKNRNDD